VKKKIFSICLSVVVLVSLIAVLVPGCTGDGEEGTIEVKATLCDEAWEGDVDYTLTPASGSAVTGTNVSASFTVDVGNWTCEHVSGGPADAYLEDIKPSATQEVSDGGTITFTLEFEENQDAWIDFLYWTIDGEPVQEMVEVVPCQIIDIHFEQGVEGCEGRIVAVNETSRLWIHYIGYTEEYMGEPICGDAPPSAVYVVNDWCAVNKIAEPPEKVSQNTTHWGKYVQKGEFIDLICCEEEELDVETIWELEKEIDYTKSINWLGISFDPGMHPCVLFDLLVMPMGVPGWYVFSLTAEAEVVLMDDEDVDIGNNTDVSSPLTIWVYVGP